MENPLIAHSIESQYKASLGMLRAAINSVPEEQWNNEQYSYPNWQIAYHTLWGINFYLGANPESYVPFEGALEGAESLGGTQDWENPDPGVVVVGHHTKEELFTFIDFLRDNLAQRIAALPLDEHSGFQWYPYSRLELHINTIRHTQHHTAQIIERLKANDITGFTWWTDGNPPQEW